MLVNVKVFQVSQAAMINLCIPGENNDFTDFMIKRWLDDSIELNRDWYEQTNELTLSVPTALEALNLTYQCLNIGPEREAHPSYSLSMNDVLLVGETYYRVAMQGFKVLDDWDAPSKNSISQPQRVQLSNQTLTLRAHEDVEFDVFVYPTEEGYTFLEGYTEGSWDESYVTKLEVQHGRVYPPHTNVSPYHLRQDETYLICYYNQYDEHCVATGMTASNIEEWLREDNNVIAYKDLKASIYIEAKHLSLAAYKRFIGLY